MNSGYQKNSFDIDIILNKVNKGVDARHIYLLWYVFGSSTNKHKSKKHTENKMNTNLVVPGITDLTTLDCLTRVSNLKLYCKAVEAALTEKCIFCNIDSEINKVLVGNEFWHAWQSPCPERFTRHHFIMVPKRHVKETGDLTNKEKLGLFDIVSKLVKKYILKARGILIRDGDARFSSGTIQHLHCHLVVPDGTGRVALPLCDGEDVAMECYARAVVFEKLRNGSPIANLTKEEYNLVKDRV